MRYVVLILLPFLAIFLQSTLFGFYSIKGTIPDMVLVFVVIHAFLHKSGESTSYGFLCGLLEDLYTGRFIGINALSKGLTAYIVGRLQGHLFKENLVVGVMVVFFGTILNSFFLFVLSLAVTDIFHLDMSILSSVFYQSVYNIIITIPVYMWYYNSSKSGILKPTGEM